MKLAISNIAWALENDSEMYAFLNEQGVSGLEIAPTRLFPIAPYDHLAEAKEWVLFLQNRYGLEIPSMQSIWYGKNESIFGTEEDRANLLNYTQKAIHFAETLHCPNMVFGCPRNRNIPGPEFKPIAIDFFYQIGLYAHLHHTTIAIEANPPYYNTNFINTTTEAIEICREIHCEGVKVNIDLGTMINYEEDLDLLDANMDIVNHIHISEPMLAEIKNRDIHRRLKGLSYDRYFSIEMKKTDDLQTVKNIICYIREILL
ncbi:MAG TPA: TIM barrel protein [Anaerolineaceae bacterium]|nr:TIM barrel protein [Anaerolineaceae bacterium]HPN50654.1 TIM barrel protein [Anaerolineaceae bacterium]